MSKMIDTTYGVPFAFELNDSSTLFAPDNEDTYFPRLCWLGVLAYVEIPKP
jgi:hypothetical protein